MSWTVAQYVAQFDALASGAAPLATEAEKILWFNEGQTKLTRFKQMVATVAFVADADTAALPSDFHHLDKLIMEQGSNWQPFFVFGDPPVLRVNDSDGFSESGNVIVYYWAYWDEMVAGGAE